MNSNLKSSSGIFILIFSVYWISDSLVLYFFEEYAQELVIKFIIISFVAFILISIYNYENRRIRNKIEDLIEKSSSEALNSTNKILSYISMPINNRLSKVCEIIKSEFHLEEVFISVKKFNYLDVVDIPPLANTILGDSRMSLKLNRNHIKALIVNDFLSKDNHIDYKKINKKINGVMVNSILNIQITSKYSKENLGVITLFLPKNKGNRDEIILQLSVIAENIGINLFIDRQTNKKTFLTPNNEKHHQNSEIEIKESMKNTIVYVNLNDIEIYKKITNKKDFHIENSMISLVRNLIRDIDVSTLWQGNKFIILFPEDDISGASILINRLKEKIKELELENLETSFGIVQFEKINSESRLNFIDRLEKTLSEGI